MLYEPSLPLLQPPKPGPAVGYLEQPLRQASHGKPARESECNHGSIAGQVEHLLRLLAGEE